MSAQAPPAPPLSDVVIEYRITGAGPLTRLLQLRSPSGPSPMNAHIHRLLALTEHLKRSAIQLRIVNAFLKKFDLELVIDDVP